MSEFLDWGWPAIIWKQRSSGYVFEFDNGSEIDQGNYRCCFTRIVNGEKKRVVQVALSDEKRWAFYQHGEPVAIEDIGLYKSRLIKERLNSSSLSMMAKRVGIDLLDDSTWAREGIKYEVHNPYAFGPRDDKH